MAAWLYGSIGRQEADGLSDLDVRLVVADAECQAMLAERHMYVERVAVPLLIPGRTPERATRRRVCTGSLHRLRWPRLCRLDMATTGQHSHSH